MKLKAPSKDCLIYRVVSWLNTKVVKGNEPKNSCQLGWYSIFWTIAFVNAVAIIITPFALLLGYESVLYILLDGHIASLGGSIGLLTFGLLYLVVTSWVTYLIVGLYCILSLLHYYIENKSIELNVNGCVYTNKDAHRGLLLIGFAIHYVFHKVYKLLSKIKIDCEDIK